MGAIWAEASITSVDEEPSGKSPSAGTPLSITWIDLLLDCQKRVADAEL